MKYLLDSNICIRYLNQRSQSIIDKMESTSPDDIVVCSIVKAEMYFGAKRSQKPVKTRAEQDAFLVLFQSLPFDDAAAEIYSNIRADLAARGTPIGPNDLMIAAIAIANNLILITHNTREFSRVTGLSFEDWEEVRMKIGIVGTGFVGATAAYALVMRGVGREIVLVDKNTKRAEAEADDILHAVPFAHPMEIFAGDYIDLAGCSVVIMAAGVNQKPGETRMELLSRNASVFRDVIPQIISHAPDSVIVVATNPVDVMTHYSAGLAAEQGWAAGRVFGSGTTLDTARFRSLLSRQFGIDSAHIHASVIGEHGDSEVLAWSMVSVGGIPLEDFITERHIHFDQVLRDEIDHQVRHAAYHIIEGKGATYYGIGSALARIVDVILHDQRAILTVCAPEIEVAGVRDVTVALPRLVGGKGVMERLPLPINALEQEKLQRSAAIVRQAIDLLEQA